MRTIIITIWRWRGRVATSPTRQPKRPLTTTAARIEAAINTWKEVCHSIRPRHGFSGLDGMQNRALFFCSVEGIIGGGYPFCCPSASMLYARVLVLSRHGVSIGETCCERNTTPISSSLPSVHCLLQTLFSDQASPEYSAKNQVGCSLARTVPMVLH